ncbi:MAG: ABC transporter substrate-binding protein [Gammaproteobacteria bacterium]|nr:ABC transporter substrate-binding protein [Gammaproteobacteria bacterium]
MPQGLMWCNGRMFFNTLNARLARFAGLAVCVGALALAAGMARAAQFESAPHQLIADTSTDLLRLIEEGRGYADSDPERFFTAVEALLAPVVDFEGFARRVMSAHYKQATPEQRQRFAETFKWGLVRTYSLTLTDFTDGEVIVVPPDGPPRHPRRRNVKMEIHQGGEIYPVLYAMTQNADGGWRIGNIVIAGVNIGLTYRSQFKSVAADARYGGDLDQVIEAWVRFVSGEKTDQDGAGSGAAERQQEDV